MNRYKLSIFYQDYEACHTLDKLLGVMKKNSDQLGLARRLLGVIKLVLDNIEQETKSQDSELKLPISVLNLIIEIVEIFNNSHLINEFKEDLAPVIECVNKYFNQNLDGENLRLYVCFYIRIFKERSNNFRHICK